MPLNSVLYGSRTVQSAAVGEGGVPASLAARGVRHIVIGERVLERLGHHLGWRPTRALAARFLIGAQPAPDRDGVGRRFFRFRVFGQPLLAEVCVGRDGSGDGVWVATHFDRASGRDGRARDRAA